MSLVEGLSVVQIGGGLAAAVCGRLFADIGAAAGCIEPDESTPLAQYLNTGKQRLSFDAVAAADIVVCEGGPAALRERRCDPAALRRRNPRAVLVLISPFGQTGPAADEPASDLTLFFASGIARMLTGQVDDLAEPPIRPVGRQSAFIGGIAAACAAMQAALAGGPALIDVSIQEALATIAITELARAGTGGRTWSRKRTSDGNGATVCILPAADGYAAISPRDDHQWAAWLTVMGSPEWSGDPRFATKSGRIANWDALYEMMCGWSRRHDKQWIADRAQDAHVPSFPLREPLEQLASPQLAARGFWRPLEIADRPVRVPGPPFGLTIAQNGGTGGRAGSPGGGLPLAGVRVLDFSWVIAGPTATRYLAAMGAEVIKVEAPGRGDPGRASELHSVLGQGKRAIVLDLKVPQQVTIARALAARCDLLIENFATGVMDRLGLGAADLASVNPNLIYVSASGLGRAGPEARAVAYGTLLQCYVGFAGLNRHPDRPPRVGLAWLDPMCGLMLAFVAAAALWRRRRSGDVARVDFSMLEAMLWTMAEPLIEAQSGAPPQPRGNASARCAPHGAYRCAATRAVPGLQGIEERRQDGGDEWLSLAVADDRQWRALCALVPGLAALAGLGAAERRQSQAVIDSALVAWACGQDAATAARALREAGIAAAALAGSADLTADPHLRSRGFWEPAPGGVLPGLPWQSSFGRKGGAAPVLGADTESVLRSMLGLSDREIAALHQRH